MNLPEIEFSTKLRFLGLIKNRRNSDGSITRTFDTYTRPPLDILKQDQHRYESYREYYKRFYERNNKNRIFLVYVIFDVEIFEEIPDETQPNKVRIESHKERQELQFRNIKGKKIFDRISELFNINTVSNIVVKDVIDITATFHPVDIQRHIDEAYSALIDGKLSDYFASIINPTLRQLLYNIIQSQERMSKYAVEEYIKLNEDGE